MKLQAAGAFSATCVFIGILSMTLETSAYFACSSSSCSYLLDVAGVLIFSLGLVGLEVAAVTWGNSRIV